MQPTDAAIRGLGFHVPERILTNAELEAMVDTSDEWITARTGIKERHVAAKGQAVSDLALESVQSALDDAGMDADELTHIIVATLTPDAYVPSSATNLEYKLGISGKVAFDLNAACSGFTYALDMGRSIIARRPEARVAVTGAEILTTRTDWTDRSTCVLFGDGAGTAVLQAAEDQNHRIIDIILKSDGAYGDLLTVLGGGSGHPYEMGQAIDDDYFIRMQGRDVFKVAVRSMESVALEILADNGFGVDQVDLLIPHQANQRIIEAVGKKLSIEGDRVYSNVASYGNTSAASVPIALAEAKQTGRLSPNDLAMVVSFGGGFTWGAALIRL